MSSALAATIRIPPAVARKLGFYVYLYVDPRDDVIFYVGKGKNGRALAHFKADEKRSISRRIRRIRAAGAVPRVEILAHGLRSAEVALQIESAAIDILGLQNLANAVRGHKALYGRMALADLVAQYTRRRADIREPAVLIRINKLHRFGMSATELYDATRSAWRVGPDRSKATYAFAVFEGVVREVYHIAQWLPAGTTFNTRRDKLGMAAKRRWEFVGIVADKEIRERYINRYVGHLFTRGAQNPISYVNVG